MSLTTELSLRLCGADLLSDDAVTITRLFLHCISDMRFIRCEEGGS